MAVLDYEADIESDLSAFHRVDDPMTMDGPRYFRLALRLAAYMGVMAARAQERDQQERPTAAPTARHSHATHPQGQTARVDEDVLFANLSDGWLEHTKEDAA